jgi:excisionase family DNA binding protein
MVRDATPASDRARPEGLQVLTLGQAARLTGTSKTTLTRAIRAGRLSATRRDDGGYEIDPAELSRVYVVTPATPETGAATGDVVHHATPASDPAATPCDPEVTARLAALDAEVKGLRELLAEVKANREELRSDRDDWKGRAERLLTDQRPPSVWRRLFG